jgi:hypothetical protein
VSPELVGPPNAPLDEGGGMAPLGLKVGGADAEPLGTRLARAELIGAGGVKDEELGGGCEKKL